MRRFALFAVTFILSSATPALSQQSSTPSSASPVIAPVSAEKAAENRADVLMARKEFAAAIDVYQSIIKDEPKNAVVLNKLGVAYQQMGGISTAEKYYKRAASADKKFSSPVNNLGTLEYGEKHYTKSIRYYHRALGMTSPSATVYRNLGYAYYADKKMDLAMDSFSKALALDPTIFENHGGSGSSVIQEGSAPDPGSFNFYLAKAYAKTGNAERTAHYLKLARDYNFKDLQAAVEKDKDFAAVLKDVRVQDVLLNRPSYAGESPTPAKP